MYIFPVAVARSSFNDNGIRYCIRYVSKYCAFAS